MTIKKWIVDQSKLSSECWLIQIQGISACARCELKNTNKCGGKAIRNRKGLVNQKGFTSNDVSKRV